MSGPVSRQPQGAPIDGQPSTRGTPPAGTPMDEKVASFAPPTLSESKQKEKVELQGKATNLKQKVNTDNMISSLEAALNTESQEALSDWIKLYAGQENLSNLPKIDLIRLTPLLLKANTLFPEFLKEVSPLPRTFEELKEIFRSPESRYQAAKMFIQKIKSLGLSHEEEMAALAAFIEHKKLPISDLPDLSDYDWALLGKYLRYLDLTALKLTKIEYLFEHCSNIIYLEINNPYITEIPDLPYCKVFYCSYCTKLQHLPYLPECEIVTCSYCENLSLDKAPSLWNRVSSLFHTNILGMTESRSLPKCKRFECTHCNFSSLPELPVCEEVKCNDNKLLKELPSLFKCKILIITKCPLITHIPETPLCTKFNGSMSGIEQLPPLDNCEEFICSRTKISKLPSLSSCKHIEAEHCMNLTHIPRLQCNTINITGCQNVQTISDQPFCESLKANDCYGLTQIGAIPRCLVLSCKKSLITQLPELLLCEEIYLSGCTQIRQLPPLPSCNTLDVRNCTNLEILPEVPFDAYVYSSNTPAGEISVFIIDKEDFTNDPKKILLALGDFLLNNKSFPNVYYNFQGNRSEAVDVGGVRRDCISSLCENLFLGKGDQFLSMEDGIPMMKGQTEQDCYRTLGAILTLCYPENSYFKTGPFFDQKVYEMGLNRIFIQSDEEIENWYLTCYLNFLNAPEYVYEIVNLDKGLPAFDHYKLTMLSYFIDPTGMTELKEEYLKNYETRKEFRNKLLKEALEDSRLKAINTIFTTLLERSMSYQLNTLKTIDSKTFMDRVQGQLNAEIVLQKIEWEQNSNVSNSDFDKTKAYLTNWINNADEETLRKFVRAVTANNSIGNSAIFVEIFNRDQQFIPVAHTCSFTIELSGNYISQEQFDNKLNMLLTLGMAGSGYQIA